MREPFYCENKTKNICKYDINNFSEKFIYSKNVLLILFKLLVIKAWINELKNSKIKWKEYMKAIEIIKNVLIFINKDILFYIRTQK